MAKLKENKLFKFLSSTRLAFALFCALILACLIGALVSEEFRQDIYYSWWFLFLLFLFSGNLLACCLSRTSTSFKKIGSTLTHLSILIILAGSLYSYLFAIRGTVEFVEGEDRTGFVSNRGSQQLGFKVILDDFNLTWYSPFNHKIKVFVQDKGLRQVFLAKLQTVYNIKGSGYSFSVLRYFPDFKVDESGIARNNSEQPDNPAILIEIKTSQGAEQRWLFSKHPEIVMAKDKNIKFLFVAEPMIKEFASHVRFIDASRQQPAVIKVNSPSEFKGYTFYQSSYDAERLNWTALEVVKDPGVFWVFFGFVLLNAGIVINFVQKTSKNKLLNSAS